jgi:pimeloyl-ACP methyl ester carboxylesterase
VRRPARFLLKILAAMIVVLIVAGVVYEQLGRRWDKRRYPQVGRSVDIGGRSLNIYCSGDSSPTVVLENAVGYRWMPIQREVTKFTHACWYDQAGYGWSDPGPKPRTSAAVASDLHALLRAAAVPPPYVLVGASGDGFPVRVFAARHLNEVAGIVLIDAAHEDQYGREPRSSLGWANRLPTPVRSALYTVAPVAGEIGLFRLMLRPTRTAITRRQPPEGMTPDEAQYLFFLSRLPRSFVTEADEGRNWKASADEARNAGMLGDVPLIVLTGAKFVTPRNPADVAEARAFHQTWVNELQPKLARLSSRGRQIMIENSGHGIQFEAPDVLIGAIREIVGESRGEPAKVRTASRVFIRRHAMGRLLSVTP